MKVKKVSVACMAGMLVILGSVVHAVDKSPAVPEATNPAAIPVFKNPVIVSMSKELALTPR